MLSTGVRCMGPPFIAVGENIVVDTNEIIYVKRAD
jgi:elongation factor P